MKRPVLIGVAAAAMLLTWQFLTVRYNYGGNWSALFCTGALMTAPPAGEFSGTYAFAGSNGYDGQFYRYIAHDPFFERGFSNWVDAPRLRYRRALVPLLAYAGALGSPGLIDAAYIAIVAVFVFLGAWWASSYAAACGRHPAWGFGFLLVPSALVSADRLTVDVSLAALACAWALHAGGRTIPRKAGWAVLAAIPLARETGLLLNAATGIRLAWVRKFRELAMTALALTPCALWYLFVAIHTRSEAETWVSYAPLSGWAGRVLHPAAYGPQVPFRSLVVALDYVALAGIALAVALGMWLWFRRRDGAVEIAIALFCVLVVQTGRPDVWADAFSFGRVFSPLLLLLGLKGLETGSPLLGVPMALVALRVGAQLAPQVLGIARGLL